MRFNPAKPINEVFSVAGQRLVIQSAGVTLFRSKCFHQHGHRRNNFISHAFVVCVICSRSGMDVVKDKVSDNIGNMRIIPLKESLYMKPFRAEFEINGKHRYWDFLKVHDSVSILIHNISRDVLVLVRQFRPAMYLAHIPSVQIGAAIDTEKHDLSKGYSLELCAGIVDKDLELKQVAKQEVLEECGYDVPVSSLRKICSFRNVGISGQQNTIFFVEVTDNQKVNEGGGLKDEGEFIEVIEMTIPDIVKYVESLDVLSPASFIAAIHWFLAKRKRSD